MSGRGDLADYEDFVSERGVEGITHAYDDDGAFWVAAGVTTQPSFVFVNDDGTYDTHTGALGLDGIVERSQALADA